MVVVKDTRRQKHSLFFCHNVSRPEDEALHGMWWPDSGSVHPPSRSQLGVARRLPQMLRVQHDAGRVAHMLRTGRQDILQAGLPQVNIKTCLYYVMHTYITV